MAAEGGGISVDGTRILKDGQERVPKGFTLVGFVAPEKYMSAGFKEARDLYGPQELERAEVLWCRCAQVSGESRRGA